MLSMKRLSLNTHTAPHIILSDNGKEFANDTMGQLLKCVHLKVVSVLSQVPCLVTSFLVNLMFLWPLKRLALIS